MTYRLLWLAMWASVGVVVLVRIGIAAPPKRTHPICRVPWTAAREQPLFVVVRGQFALSSRGIVLTDRDCAGVQVALTESVSGIVGLSCPPAARTGIACALAGRKGRLLGTVSGILKCPPNADPSKCSIDVWDINDVSEEARP